MHSTQRYVPESRTPRVAMLFADISVCSITQLVLVCVCVCVSCVRLHVRPDNARVHADTVHIYDMQTPKGLRRVSSGWLVGTAVLHKNRTHSVFAKLSPRLQSTESTVTAADIPTPCTHVNANVVADNNDRRAWVNLKPICRARTSHAAQSHHH